MAAQFHIDKHVVKMTLETAQLLCSVHHMTGNSTVPYRLTHKNHPCAIWARQSLSNYNWLYKLGLALLKEYSYRYNKSHKTAVIIKELQRPDLKDIGLTPFALAMPNQYKRIDAVESYRLYYMGEKRNMAYWKRRERPYWWK